jgi:uncharacterized protein
MLQRIAKALACPGISKLAPTTGRNPMRSLRYRILIIVFLAFFIPPLQTAAQEAVLNVGQRLKIRSQFLNEDREAWVYLPPSYTDKYFQEQHYPVLYVLDGDLHFHSLTGLIHILGSGVNGTYVLPEMIVVAILNTDRTRDMTPTHTTVGVDKKKWDFLSSSGGNDKFLSFIKDELAPKIESTFRTVPYRIFVGHSFGGLAVLNALCTVPELFNAYVLIDPSLWWDDQVMVNRAAEKLMKSDLRGKSLFVAQGNTLNSWDSINYHFESIREFSTVLETRNRSGIRWQYRYYVDDGHSSVAFPAASDALRFIFKKYHATFTDINSAAELNTLYENFSREVNFKFLPPERVCQQFGGISLFLKKPDEAEKYFLMNLANYPESSAAYANMGQLWRSRGDRKKALEFYQKSLTFFPGNEDSKTNVDQLTQELKAKK